MIFEGTMRRPGAPERGSAVGRRAAALLAVVALGGPLGACGPDAASPPATGGDAGVPEPEASYLAPPSVLSAAQAAGGAITVQGRAPPGAVIQLASPDGRSVRAQADRKGMWRSTLPLGQAPRLFALSALAKGRVLHADGALLLAPGALAPAVTLRAGAAALPLTPASDGAGLDIATADYDPSGFLAVGGHAPPNAAVTLTVDGTPAAAGHADALGRYALLAAGRRLSMGPHRLQAAAPGAAAEREVSLTSPASLSAPYAVERAPEGWRVEWALTGGGVQTTLLPAA